MSTQQNGVLAPQLAKNISCLLFSFQQDYHKIKQKYQQPCVIYFLCQEALALSNK
jgi:hypothetical protein